MLELILPLTIWIIDTRLRLTIDSVTAPAYQRVLSLSPRNVAVIRCRQGEPSRFSLIALIIIFITGVQTVPRDDYKYVPTLGLWYIAP